MYIMLSGTMPFEGDNEEAMFEAIKEGAFAYPVAVLGFTMDSVVLGLASFASHVWGSVFAGISHSRMSLSFTP
jgi:hypothetical protein